MIENNGAPGFEGYGIRIDGKTYDIMIEGNTIRSTGKGSQAAAIFIGPWASRIDEKENRISGHPGVVKGNQDIYDENSPLEERWWMNSENW